jgi:type VI secretion system protein ImpM
VPVDEVAPLRLLAGAASWYEQVEELALAALADGAELDGFDAAVAAVGRPEPGDAPAIPYRLGGAIGFEADDPSALAPALLDAVLAGSGAPFSLWATSGSERLRPMLLYAAGLPPSGGFAALLDGSWERWGWMKRR